MMARWEAGPDRSLNGHGMSFSSISTVVRINDVNACVRRQAEQNRQTLSEAMSTTAMPFQISSSHPHPLCAFIVEFLSLDVLAKSTRESEK